MAMPTFQERKAQLDATEAEGAPIGVNGDHAALERLFLNLCLNAAQALEPEGAATLRIEIGEDDVRVLIQDNGRGIRAEDLARVFDPFFSTRPDGTGLGLPISLRIAQAHGGDLSLESDLGEGTTVTVRLPQ
jgi:signal transduction histidine kinase